MIAPLRANFRGLVGGCLCEMASGAGSMATSLSTRIGHDKPKERDCIRSLGGLVTPDGELFDCVVIPRRADAEGTHI